MRSVEEQLAIITSAAVTPEPVRIAITETLGLRCAERVEGSEPLPGFDQAAIDGYAVRSVDIRQALTLARGGDHGDTSEGGKVAENLSGVKETLPIVGDVTAGSLRPIRLQPRQAVRVEMGAPLPTLADSVLPLDWVEKEGRKIRPLEAIASGEFVHRKGSDVQPGDVVVEEGAVIGAAQVGLLAAVGRSKVLVYPRPRLSVLSFGRELLDIDRDPAVGQVYDVNSYALAAAAREAGADVHRVGILSGEPRKMREVIESQLLRSEVVVISGAIGGAASDELREILSEMGAVSYTHLTLPTSDLV